MRHPATADCIDTLEVVDLPQAGQYCAQLSGMTFAGGLSFLPRSACATVTAALSATLSATPPLIDPGNSSSLSWTTNQPTNNNITVTAVSIRDTSLNPVCGVTGVPPCAQPYAVSPAGTTSYTLTVAGTTDGNPDSFTTSPPTTVTVNPPVFPQLSVASVSFNGGLSLSKDLPNGNTTITNPVWTSSPAKSDPIAYVSGSTMTASVTFTLSPIPSVPFSGVRIEGSMSGNLGKLVATGVTIPAGASSITVGVTADHALASSTTVVQSPLTVSWQVSSTGADCGSASCSPAGSSSDPLYVTLASPTLSSPIPLTVMQRGVGGGGATTQAQAFQNTWAQFAGPANVKGWDGRSLYYYSGGFSGSCLNTIQLLTSTTGNGQCGSFAHLFQDALAVNGISSQWTTVSTLDNSKMVIKNWGFGTPSFGPGDWELDLVAVPQGSGLYSFDMVPWSGSQYGDLTNLSGLPGQNSPTPAEKVFDLHFIVMTTLQGVGGPYFDPSYGVTYSGAAAFETSAVVGYASNPSLSRDKAKLIYHFRQPSSTLNIQFQ